MPAEVDQLITEFFQWNFSLDMSDTYDKYLQLHAARIMFSKRSCTAKHSFHLVESPDSNTTRDVMYKYSRKARDIYFSYPVESFMFAAFALSDEG